jgi:hypothetical protein
LNPLFRVESSADLSSRTKKSIGLKFKNLISAIASVEQVSGLKYPEYYVEPTLTVVPATGVEADSVAALYARTIPFDINGRVKIMVEFSAPLLLYCSKRTLRFVVAHELLHYVELVRNFVAMNFISEITSSYVYEEQFNDSSRALKPSLVFKDKRFAKNLEKKTSAGLDDPKLNEKCRIKWIEKSMPTKRISMGRNQTKIPVDSVIKTEFDPKVREIISMVENK